MERSSVDMLPFETRFDLPGWELYGALLDTAGSGDEPDGAALAAVRAGVVEGARASRSLKTLAASPTVAALRRLFRAAGCDPTRYRPSSEALLRRVLKGDDLPVISPLVDINNALSLELAVPCCVMAQDTVHPPLVLRAGEPDEAYESLRGPFKLAGKPLLVDQLGPCDSPITGNTRVKVDGSTRRAWLLAYLPEGVVTAQEADDVLRRLLHRAPVARIEHAGRAASAA